VQQASGRGDQHETVHPVRGDRGNLLRDDAAERDAQHVRPAHADGVQHGHGEAGQRGQRHRVRRDLRVTDAGRVERDRAVCAEVRQQPPPGRQLAPDAVHQ